MSFGKNLQFLRKISNRMTQEELAEKLSVSRQSISKWELDIVYPEIDKLLELCNLFSCSLDQLIREDMSYDDEAYSDIRIEEVPAFCYLKYSVISMEPEDDAIAHVKQWAQSLGINNPTIIGWDFPKVSQEQINVFNMHGYCAALILNDSIVKQNLRNDILYQGKQRYIAITIKQPSLSPFYTIPNAYKVLMAHMNVNGIQYKKDEKIISCFEKEYEKGSIDYMDIYIAIE